MFHVERVYGHLKGPGQRVLVDRLWPRGIQKSALKLDGWFKDLAPSNELRKWFHHDPAQYEEFTRRYIAELEAHPDTWAPLLEAGRAGDVTLLFGAKEETFNNAHVLKDFLERKLGGAASAANAVRESGAAVAETQRAGSRGPGGSKWASRGGAKTSAGGGTKSAAKARGKASARGGAKRASKKGPSRSKPKAASGTKRAGGRKTSPKPTSRSRRKAGANRR